MSVNDLWKYCTAEQEKEMLLSLRLLDGMPVKEDKYLPCLYAVSNHTDQHYHTASIKKKSGGMRKLLVPDALLSTIQKNILHHVLNGFPAADAAKAYKAHVSPIDNALPHVGAEQIVKLDIKNFFDNITYFLVYQYAFPAEYFPPAVRTMLTALCCCHDYLPQGAPTSPGISNLVMKSFDKYMTWWCRERGIHYTRYCDDMTFSGNLDEKELINKVRSFLQVMGFQLNEKKTRILKGSCRKTVTGIVVNEIPQVSRDYRRKLRAEIHYCRKFGVEEHVKRMGKTEWMAAHGPDTERYIYHLLGKVNYVLHVNPKDEYFVEARKFLQTLVNTTPNLLKTT
ncbi:MAG: reverse transcriptase family protein [Eubacteriales bacterium]|nr:reverse transcriptase family protein [Eubacteriales bacterium]